MFFPPAHQRLSLESILNSPEDLWIRRKCSNWLLRILDYEAEMDNNFFSCCAWVLGDASQFLQDIREKLDLPKGRTKDLSYARQELKKLECQGQSRSFHTLENLCGDNISVRKSIGDFCIGLLESWRDNKGSAGKSIFPKGFASLFGLDAAALECCAFIWALGNYMPVESYFEDTLSLSSSQNFPILARMLNIPKQSFRLLLSHLDHLGILESHRHSLRLSDNMAEALALGNFHDMQNFFCKPLPDTDVPLWQFQLPKEDKTHILALMGQKNKKPAHLLLYGAPGTGKTSFASCIVNSLGVKAWAVACRERDSVSDRRLALMACAHLARKHPGSIILVDEAERILDTDIGDLEKGSSKAWLNSLLEQEGLRIIWITNKVRHLDQAVRRRFSFSAHFETPGKRESLHMWNNVASRARVESRLPIESREKFAELYQVPVAVMESAVLQAKSLVKKRDFPDCVERILKAHICLRQNGTPPQNVKSEVAPYNPKLACANVQLDKLITKLEKLRGRMEKEEICGKGNLLFYGPPGTGKTAFAKHLAEKLGCECVARRASDLISPYVGETEQRIAQSFAEAEKNHDLLLIDEADSFIFGRENATRSWEQTMVNEFLTALESFGGICVCATNFREVIDSAAMRRFPFKVGFNYATPEQLVSLYDLCLAPLCKDKAPDHIYESLRGQKTLAPGDFNAVRSQFWLEEPSDLTHDMLLRALLKEQKLKLEQGAKSVGF